MLYNVSYTFYYIIPTVLEKSGSFRNVTPVNNFVVVTFQLLSQKINLCTVSLFVYELMPLAMLQ